MRNRDVKLRRQLQRQPRFRISHTVFLIRIADRSEKTGDTGMKKEI